MQLLEPDMLNMRKELLRRSRDSEKDLEIHEQDFQVEDFKEECDRLDTSLNKLINNSTLDIALKTPAVPAALPEHKTWRPEFPKPLET